MEKLIYLLKAEAGSDRKLLVERLRAAGERMARLEPAGLRLNLQDGGVDWGDAIEHHPALGLISLGPFEAIVQLWLEDASAAARAPYEVLIAEVFSQFHGYRVEERVLVHNVRQSARPGERNDGFSQIAILQKPDYLSRDAWLSGWQGRHTWVALSIHPHLEYIQNLVVETLTPDAPPVFGIGEEGFPMAGLHDERPLFRGADTDEAYERLHQIMYEDAQRFIDFERLDMMVSSQFDIRPPLR